jgi:hypothetical protein
MLTVMPSQVIDEIEQIGIIESAMLEAEQISQILCATLHDKPIGFIPEPENEIPAF